MNHLLDPLIRFLEHLPKNGDVELSLLKCHLLCEEVLTKSIERQLRAPENLMDARLSFAQKIHLARCQYPDQHHNWLWPALKKLNDARNKLAHGLEPTEIESRIEAFTSLVETSQKPPSGGIGRFQWAAFCVFAKLAAFANFDPTAHKSAYATILSS